MLRFTIGLVLATAALASLGFAHAQPTDDSLRIYAVDIWQDPPQSWGHGDPRCCDHRKFRVRRIRRRTEMLARHHEPENLRACEQRRSRRKKTSPNISCRHRRSAP